MFRISFQTLFRDFVERHFEFLYGLPLYSRSQTPVHGSPFPVPRSPFPVLVTPFSEFALANSCKNRPNPAMSVVAKQSQPSVTNVLLGVRFHSANFRVFLSLIEKNNIHSTADQHTNQTGFVASSTLCSVSDKTWFLIDSKLIKNL